MKKTYLVRRNALLSFVGLSWGTGAFVLVIVLVVLRILVPNLFLSAVAPLMQTGTSLAFDTYVFFSGFENAQLLAASNHALLNENISLALENRALQEKNQTLTALLGDQSSEQTPPGVVAAVVAMPPESPYDTLTILGGTNEGIKPGMDAFGTGGVPIGIVSTALTDYARVSLFSTPGETFSAWVGTARTPVVMTGTGGGTFSASVSRSAPIVTGDAVFIPGSDIPIGTVTSITGDPSLPTVALHISPASNPFSTTMVVIRMTTMVFPGTTASTSLQLP